MKTSLFPPGLLLVPSLFAPWLSWAQEGHTNEVYVTDNGRVWLDGTSAGGVIDPRRRVLDPRAVEDAMRTSECQPASQFHEGNWGKRSGGYELSLRFTKEVFSSDEPVTAIVLIRNATNSILDYRGFVACPMRGPVQFKIVSESGRLIEEQEFTPGVVGAMSFSKPLFPSTQHKYLEDLRRGYNLTNGLYRVTGFLKAWAGNETFVGGRRLYDTVEVDSSEVDLRIVPAVRGP